MVEAAIGAKPSLVVRVCRLLLTGGRPAPIISPRPPRRNWRTTLWARGVGRLSAIATGAFHIKYRNRVTDRVTGQARLQQRGLLTLALAEFVRGSRFQMESRQRIGEKGDLSLTLLRILLVTQDAKNPRRKN